MEICYGILYSHEIVFFFVVPANSSEDLDVLDGNSKGDGPFPPLY